MIRKKNKDGKKRKIRIIRRLVLLCLMLMVWGVRYFPGCGEFYARKLYPAISTVLSLFSFSLPFSLGDVFIYSASLGVVVYLVFIFLRRSRIKKGLIRTLEFLCWVYVWFYLSWGLNYFRENFYTRNNIQPLAFQKERFQSFLDDYVEELNHAYRSIQYPEKLTEVRQVFMLQEAQKGYRKIASRFGMVEPTLSMSPKPMLFNRMMSSVGVLGYMGPFFAEFHLNRELLLVQYPFSYVHEMAHRLGVANEAEANLYAFIVTSGSEDPLLRFSGYLGVFGYVAGNARKVLNEEEYARFRGMVSPDIFTLYREIGVHWDSLYSPWIGELQHKVYNLFLKGNNIPSGTLNYAEVVGLIIAWQDAEAK